MMPAVFHLREEQILLETNDAEVGALAARLWHAGPPRLAPTRPSISLQLDVIDGPGIERAPEDRLAWHRRDDGFELDVGSALRGRLWFGRREARLTITRDLLARHGAFVLRTALEAPAAALLARGAFVAIHAAAVCGPRGALVLRGRSGAGKSTLAAAAVQAGLRVLGDESVLVARDDPDFVVASVREVLIRPDSATLLGLRGRKSFTPGERDRKVVVALPALERPEDRAARRIATWILGPRDEGPARVVALASESFLHAFADGATPEELGGGDAVWQVRDRWALGATGRLEGTVDLAGAIRYIGATVA